MKRIILVVVCLVLALAGTTIPTASAASITTSSKTTLVSCLQQEYLMRDTYQDVLAKYPTLTAFGTVTTDEVVTIATLKQLFAKYRISVPADSKVSAAQSLANTATSLTNADAVAINLEQSTAALMTQLSRTANNADVANAVTLIRTTSLSSHTTTFTIEQASIAAPASQRVVSFSPSQTAATFLALLGDESNDVIELSGTYHLPYTVINIDRKRPVVVRPAAGATVIFSGANIGSDPQFQFGDGGMAGNITMQGFTFDGYLLGQQGIVQARQVHDITLNDMVIRNSRANGTTGQPIQAWALYLSSNATTHATNFTANRWTVDGSNHQMGALQVYGGSHITATGWSVSNAYYAVYASSSRGPKPA